MTFFFKSNSFGNAKFKHLTKWKKIHHDQKIKLVLALTEQNEWINFSYRKISIEFECKLTENMEKMVTVENEFSLFSVRKKKQQFYFGFQ